VHGARWQATATPPVAGTAGGKDSVSRFLYQDQPGPVQELGRGLSALVEVLRETD
jgi:hypothetical protein